MQPSLFGLENRYAKQDAVPVDWGKTPAKLAQKDIDARWTKKADRTTTATRTTSTSTVPPNSARRTSRYPPTFTTVRCSIPCCVRRMQAARKSGRTAPTVRMNRSNAGELVALDTVERVPDGVRRYLIIFVDVHSRFDSLAHVPGDPEDKRSLAAASTAPYKRSSSTTTRTYSLPTSIPSTTNSCIGCCGTTVNVRIGHCSYNPHSSSSHVIILTSAICVGPTHVLEHQFVFILFVRFPHYALCRRYGFNGNFKILNIQNISAFDGVIWTLAKLQVIKTA